MLKKENYFIYQEVQKKHGSFNVWMNHDFWMRWFELEIEEKTKSKTHIPHNKEELYFTILLELSSTMSNLNIDIKTIIICILEKIGNSVIKIDLSLLKDLELTIVKQHQHKEHR